MYIKINNHLEEARLGPAAAAFSTPAPPFILSQQREESHHGSISGGGAARRGVIGVLHLADELRAITVDCEFGPLSALARPAAEKVDGFRKSRSSSICNANSILIRLLERFTPSEPESTNLLVKGSPKLTDCN